MAKSTKRRNDVRAIANELAPLVSQIARANGVTLAGDDIAGSIVDQNSVISPIIVQEREKLGSVYYIIYAKDKSDADASTLAGLGELDITLKINNAGKA